jgi:hypothetical protein
VEFEARARGDARPISRRAGRGGLQSVVYSAAVDARGRLYLSNSENELFAVDSHRIAAPPVGWIFRDRSRMGRVDALAIDQRGHLAVASHDGTIALFEAHARGDAAPIAMLNYFPDPRGEHLQGLAVDSKETLYRADPDEREVIEYVRSGKRTSRRLLRGTHTALTAPVSVAVDREGDLIVANRDGSIVTFSAGARGDVAPVRVLSGVVKAADAIAATPDGKVYVVSVSPNVTDKGTAGTLTALTSSKGLTAKTSFEPICFGNAI